MFMFEQRDKSGPMDLDPVDQTSRLAAFAVSGPDEGPSRKRLHADITTPSRPFSTTSSHRPLHFGTDTPFIFHTANLPKSPVPQYKPYDPSEWANAGFSMGQSTPGPGGPSRHTHGGGGGVEDVEMRWGDSPARQESGPSKAPEGASEGMAAEGGEKDMSETKSEDRPMATGAVSRVRKKRQKEWKKNRRDSVSTNGDGDDLSAKISSRADGPTKTEHTYHFNVPNPSLRHSEIPALLLGYLQFFVNASVVVFVLYFAVQFILTVRNDVKDKMKEYSVGQLLLPSQHLASRNIQEFADDQRHFRRSQNVRSYISRIDVSRHCEYLPSPCRAWEACMQRDPTVVGRTNVVAETFAGVINSFVDPISWKTMGFTLVTLSFLIILTNSALWNLRGRVAPSPEPPAPAYQSHHALMNQGWPPHLHQPQQYQPPHAPLADHMPGRGQIGWDEGKKKKSSWW